MPLRCNAFHYHFWSHLPLRLVDGLTAPVELVQRHFCILCPQQPGAAGTFQRPRVVGVGNEGNGVALQAIPAHGVFARFGDVPLVIGARLVHAHGANGRAVGALEVLLEQTPRVARNEAIGTFQATSGGFPLKK